MILLLPDSQMFATWNDAFARIKRCALLQTRSVRHIRDGRAGTQLRAYVAHRRADVDQQPPRWSIGLLTRRFSVILERLGQVGVIQISTLQKSSSERVPRESPKFQLVTIANIRFKLSVVNNQ